MPNPPTGFEAALAALPAARFTDFVADLWAARGYEVRQEDGLLYATHPAGNEIVIRPIAGGGWETAPPPVDLVVSATDEVTGMQTVDCRGPRDLYELVRYAVPPAESARLGKTYLGLGLEELSPPAAGAGHPEGPTGHAADGDAGTGAAEIEPGAPGDGESAGVSESCAAWSTGQQARRRRILVGAGAFFAGLVVGAAGWMGAFGAAGEGSDNDTNRSMPTTQTAIGTDGLSSDGDLDPAGLAATHLDRLESTSFTLSSAQTVHGTEGELLGSLDVTVEVDESRHFVAKIQSVGRGGRPVLGSPPIQVRLYGDGERQYRRIVSDDVTQATDSGVAMSADLNGWFYWANVFPFGGRFYPAKEYFRTLFDLVPMSVVGPAYGDSTRTLYALGVSLEPYPDVFATVDDDSAVRNLDLVASVTEAGLVRSLALDFDGQRLAQPASARVRTEYRQVETTAVDRPEWVDPVDSS